MQEIRFSPSFNSIYTKKLNEIEDEVAVCLGKLA